MRRGGQRLGRRHTCSAWDSDADAHADADSHANADAHTDTDTDANSDACAAAGRSDEPGWESGSCDSGQLVVDGQCE